MPFTSDRFIVDDTMLKIMDSLFGVQAEDMPADATSFYELGMCLWEGGYTG